MYICMYMYMYIYIYVYIYIYTHTFVLILFYRVFSHDGSFAVPLPETVGVRCAR